MNRAEREGYVEAERREAEAKAMSREDARDAAPADVVFDTAYDSPAEKHQKDYWFHDADAGTVTRFHITERRARFDPTSVAGCPVDPALLSDARITMAMTDGTEFTLQNSWRARDSRPLPCRWTGKTVFIIGNSAKTQVKVRLRNLSLTIKCDECKRSTVIMAMRSKQRIELLFLLNRLLVSPLAWSFPRPVV